MMEDAEVDVEDCSQDANQLNFESERLDHDFGSGQKHDFDGIQELLSQSNMDNESKVAVVRMLQEEGRYFDKCLTVKRSTVSSKPITSPSKRKVWTKEEKALFVEGLQRYGKSWSKIASMIPSRSLQQVTSYGRLYFRNQEKNSGIVKGLQQNYTKEVVAHIKKESTDDSVGSDIDVGSNSDSETASHKTATTAHDSLHFCDHSTSDLYRLVSNATTSTNSNTIAQSQDTCKQSNEQHSAWRSASRRRNTSSALPSKSEGVTVEHCADGDRVLPSLPKTRIQSVAKEKPLADGRNPFKLVTCRTFDNATVQATFKVKAESHALVIMDIHAHLSRREVIGLLGGHYDPDTCTLSIIRAEPCRSLSTGLQCEMDPVSQATACDRLQDQGLQVIGWYHSHPTFAPQPSHRDLDTQQGFQGWFAKCEAPFVGIIISPYLNNVGISEHTCFVIFSGTSVSGGKAPFQLPIDHVLSSSSSDILATLASLIDSCQSERRSLHQSWRQWLQKVLSSVKRFLPEDELLRSELLSNIEQCLERLNVTVA